LSKVVYACLAFAVLKMILHVANPLGLAAYWLYWIVYLDARVALSGTHEAHWRRVEMWLLICACSGHAALFYLLLVRGREWSTSRTVLELAGLSALFCFAWPVYRRNAALAKRLLS